MKARTAIAAGLVLGALAAGAWMGGKRPSAAVPRGIVFAPPAASPALADQTVSLDLSGTSKPFRERLTGPAVVFFWAGWCPPCLRELPHLTQFRSRAEAAGLQVLSVNLDREGAPAARIVVDRIGLGDLPVVLDPDGSFSARLGVWGLPTALLFDAGGREIGRLEGEADWSRPDAVEAATKALGRRAPS